MAIRYAVTDGNWSNTATWDGGTLPADTDDVYANNKTVNIDQSVTVNSLKKIAGTGITAGGQFVVTAEATVTITAGIVAADNVTNNTYLLGVDAGSAAVTLNTPEIASGPGTARVAVRALSGYTGTFTLNANISNGDTSGFNTAYSVDCLASCTLILNGNIAMPSSARSPGLAVGAAAVVTVNGDVNPGQSPGHGVTISAVSAVVTINGRVSGGPANASHGVNCIGNSQVIVNGEVVGASGSVDSYGVYLTSGSLLVNAVLTFGAFGGAPIHCKGAGAVPQFKRDGAGLAMRAPSDDNWPSATGAPITIERFGSGNPAPENVRAGVLYGPADMNEGTLAVPPADAVAAGVPVDDATGTAALRLSDLAAVTGAQIAAAVGA